MLSQFSQFSQLHTGDTESLNLCGQQHQKRKIKYTFKIRCLMPHLMCQCHSRMLMLILTYIHQTKTSATQRNEKKNQYIKEFFERKIRRRKKVRRTPSPSKTGKKKNINHKRHCKTLHPSKSHSIVILILLIESL